MRIKNYIYFSLSQAPKAILLFILFFVTVMAHGQNDTDQDSAVNIIEEGVKDVETSDNTSADEQQYFLYKWQEGYDSFRLDLRQVPDDRVKEMQKDDDFWYANTEIKKEEQEEVESGNVPLSRQSWFQTLLWLVIIGGFAAAIMWYLASSNVGLFRKRNIQTSTEVSDEIPEDIFAINYQKEIDKATAKGNYRFAIRLMFLRLLKAMAEKNIIQYKQDRTNIDYLLQLQPTRYYNNFFRITRNYEYSWYGHFDVNEDAFKIIRNDFDQFDRQLG